MIFTFNYREINNENYAIFFIFIKKLNIISRNSKKLMLSFLKKIKIKIFKSQILLIDNFIK